MSDGVFVLPPSRQTYSPAGAGLVWNVPGATVRGWVERGWLPERALTEDRHGELALRGEWVEAAWPRLNDAGRMYLELHDAEGQPFDWSEDTLLIDGHFREQEARDAELDATAAEPLTSFEEPGDYIW